MRIINNKTKILILGGVGCALVCAWAILFWETDFARLGEIANRIVAEISGWLVDVPLFLFTIAVFALPIVFFPASVIFIIAGNKAAAGECGFAEIYAYCAVGLSLNVIVTYLIARKFGKRIREFLDKRGIRPPTLADEDEYEVVLLVRMIPGNPLIIQNYVLGLMRISFAKYLMVSLPFQWVSLGAYMYFGETLFSGNIAGIIMSVGLLAVIALIARIIQKRYKSKDDDDD